MKRTPRPPLGDGAQRWADTGLRPLGVPGSPEGPPRPVGTLRVPSSILLSWNYQYSVAGVGIYKCLLLFCFVFFCARRRRR